MNNDLKKYKDELYEFLDKNESMVKLQNILNASMDSVKEEDRIKVLSVFIANNLNNLKNELENLLKIIKDD